MLNLFFQYFLFLYHFLCLPLHFMNFVLKTYYSQRKSIYQFNIINSYINLVYIEEHLIMRLTKLSLTFFKGPCTIMCLFKFEYRVGHSILQIPDLFLINASAFTVKCGLSYLKIFLLLL